MPGDAPAANDVPCPVGSVIAATVNRPSAAKTNRVVLVQEDHRTLGIGSEIAAIAAEQAFDCLDAPILRVAAPDIPAIPFAAPLEKFYMPSVEKIMTAMERVAQY